MKQDKTEKGLKHLQFVGVGREYFEKRFAEMQKRAHQEIPQIAPSFETNGRKVKK